MKIWNSGYRGRTDVAQPRFFLRVVLPTELNQNLMLRARFELACLKRGILSAMCIPIPPSEHVPMSPWVAINLKDLGLQSYTGL